MEVCLQNARALLNDVQVSGGAFATDTMLIPHFGEAYRTLYSNMMGATKRVQNAAYVNLPANTTVLIPEAYGITDFAEPEMIEERQASTPINITSTGTATPIVCLSPGHGLGTAGSMVEGTVQGVTGTFTPWGKWFVTVIDSNNFSLNGSYSDGVAGTGGQFTPWSQLDFSEVLPLDLNAQGLDGIPQQYLGNYLWAQERLQFRGATQTQQLRITYWASGTPPTNVNTQITIDNCVDFLSYATAANAAYALGWSTRADQLRSRAFGSESTDSGDGGLLGKFLAIQVSELQRGPQRRRGPFRPHRSRWGTIYLVN